MCSSIEPSLLKYLHDAEAELPLGEDEEPTAARAINDFSSVGMTRTAIRSSSGEMTGAWVGVASSSTAMPRNFGSSQLVPRATGEFSPISLVKISVSGQLCTARATSHLFSRSQNNAIFVTSSNSVSWKRPAQPGSRPSPTGPSRSRTRGTEQTVVVANGRTRLVCPVSCSSGSSRVHHLPPLYPLCTYTYSEGILVKAL